MNSCIKSGVVRGRPFGGVMTLVHNSLQKIYANSLLR